MAKALTNKIDIPMMSKDGSNPMSQTSYKSIYAVRNMFRTAGGYADQYNVNEIPGTFFFKIFFYFDNKCYTGGDGINASNLLSTDIDTRAVSGVDVMAEKSIDDHTFANSALNYLLINNEFERAELLLQFISLLANINTYSPWYFSSIEGLEEAVERKEFTDREFKIEDTRRVLNIKCLPDAMDSRIGTLLDLYRAICYSYVLKKEIVPANLRKFDMGIYLFHNPIFGLSRYKTYNGDEEHNDYAEFDLNWKDPEYRTSAKYFEFHNCEIDPNSSKSGYGELSNADGKQNEYTISIWYDSCYEKRYNEFMMREIGDAIFADLKQDAQKKEVLEHIQGPIAGTNIKPSEQVNTNINRHEEQYKLRSRWSSDSATNESIASLPSLNVTDKPQYKEDNQTNVYYGTIKQAPMNKYKSSSWLVNNVQGAVGGVMDSLNKKLTPLWLGNLFYGTGINNDLNKVSKTINDFASGSMVRSRLSNLF